ncbi:MAG TPA: DUF721 domain-containing protein [Thermodesulfovibrionales bacterium]|nr:DUF721 domain-containing protein [Thermodesulfovibrionales bacterium]
MNRIRGLLSPLVKNLGIEGALKLETMRRQWSNIIGRPLSLHIWPSSLQNNELLINVDSPVWLQQISFYKTAIMKKLQSFDVRDIRFRLGKVGSERSLQQSPSGREIRASLDHETAAYIEATISGIEDDELRDRIRKAMEKAFSR